MRLHIRPGKVTCVGFVAIFMVLPNNIWRGSDAKIAPLAKPKIQAIKKAPDLDSRSVKLRKMAH